jgi:hypothetical protein
VFAGLARTAVFVLGARLGDHGQGAGAGAAREIEQVHDLTIGGVGLGLEETTFCRS